MPRRPTDLKKLKCVYRTPNSGPDSFPKGAVSKGNEYFCEVVEFVSGSHITYPVCFINDLPWIGSSGLEIGWPLGNFE